MSNNKTWTRVRNGSLMAHLLLPHSPLSCLFAQHLFSKAHLNSFGFLNVQWTSILALIVYMFVTLRVTVIRSFQMRTTYQLRTSHQNRQNISSSHSTRQYTSIYHTDFYHRLRLYHSCCCRHHLTRLAPVCLSGSLHSTPQHLRL